MDAPLDALARWGRLMGLSAKINPRQQRPVIRGHANVGAVQDLGLQNLCRCGGQHPVKRQQRSVDRKGRFGRAAQINTQKAFGQSQATPWSPFVQITHQDRRLARLAEHKLTNGTQLRPAQRLHQRQMHANQPKLVIAARKVSNNRPAMATARQIKKGDLVDRDIRMHKHDSAQKPVTAIRPTVRGVSMQITQASGGLDTRNIQKARMGRDLLIGFLQNQRVNIRGQRFIAQCGQCAARINTFIIAATAMNVPAQASKILMCIKQRVPFAGWLPNGRQRNNNLMFRNNDTIGEINVCS